MTIMSRRTSTAADTPAPFAKWAPLAVILCGTFVFVLDFFVVDVALPSIQRDLGAGPGAIEWLVAGYAPHLSRVRCSSPAAASATTTAGGGRFSHRAGRLRGSPPRCAPSRL